jgi:hypothetical protein
VKWPFIHRGVRSVALLAGATFLPFSSSCHRTFEEPVSAINVADSKGANQLIAGFHGVESKKWRWTTRKFIVALKPPEGAEKKGAELRLHLFIPAHEIETLGSITLTADAAGYPLDPETFSEAGSYTYAREVPSDALATNILPFKFSFDKAMKPSKTDGRELGAVVTWVGLQTK